MLTYINTRAPHKVHLENAGRQFFGREKELENAVFWSWRLAESYKRPILSQLKSEMNFLKVALASLGNIITQE